MNIKSYSELVLLPTFEDRFEYLRLDGIVGETTFGFDRYMNQVFYRSLEWKKIRDTVIARDLGCDLGIEGHEIFGRVIIHHLNPIRQRDLLERTDILLDPEYLITTTHETHQAIHYGDKNLLLTEPKEEPTMQNNPRKQDIIQELRDKRQDVTELCTEAEAVNEPHTGSGIVTDCLYLNVRKLPDINADVAVVIDALTRVCVDLDASTEDFYKVRTSDGVEGFCMRKYIALSK